MYGIILIIHTTSLLTPLRYSSNPFPLPSLRRILWAHIRSPLQAPFIKLALAPLRSNFMNPLPLRSTLNHFGAAPLAATIQASCITVFPGYSLVPATAADMVKKLVPYLNRRLALGMVAQ
jgi:hypothetical protein